MSTQYHVLEYQKMNIHIFDKLTVAILKNNPIVSKLFSITSVIYCVYCLQL